MIEITIKEGILSLKNLERIMNFLSMMFNTEFTATFKGKNQEIIKIKEVLK